MRLGKKNLRSQKKKKNNKSTKRNNLGKIIMEMVWPYFVAFHINIFRSNGILSGMKNENATHANDDDIDVDTRKKTKSNNNQQQLKITY